MNKVDTEVAAGCVGVVVIFIFLTLFISAVNKVEASKPMAEKMPRRFWELTAKENIGGYKEMQLFFVDGRKILVLTDKRDNSSMLDIGEVQASDIK